MSDDKVDLLAVLEDQGKEFMRSFADIRARRKTIEADKSIRATPCITNVPAICDNEVEEWTGFASEDEDDSHKVETGAKQFLGKQSTPDVVVFCEGKSRPDVAMTKTLDRSFMSSKVSKLKQSSVQMNGNQEEHEDVDAEHSNARNDALLHRLVHTQLLSGSLNPQLNLTAPERRRAVAGRVLELSGDTKLGKGESIVRRDEWNKANKRVRDGIIAKQKERDIKSLNEAKNTGNYHPALKKLFATSSNIKPRKRDRGLKMGVGKFSGGMLTLTPDEIDSVRGVRNIHAHKASRRKKGR